MVEEDPAAANPQAHLPLAASMTFTRSRNRLALEKPHRARTLAAHTAEWNPQAITEACHGGPRFLAAKSRQPDLMPPLCQRQTCPLFELHRRPRKAAPASQPAGQSGSEGRKALAIVPKRREHKTSSARDRPRRFSLPTKRHAGLGNEASRAKGNTSKAKASNHHGRNPSCERSLRNRSKKK